MTDRISCAEPVFKVEGGSRSFTRPIYHLYVGFPRNLVWCTQQPFSRYRELLGRSLGVVSVLKGTRSNGKHHV